MDTDQLKPRGRDGIVIIILFLAAVFIIGFVINETHILDSIIVHGMNRTCAEMYLGDNWTLGYHNETVKICATTATTYKY